MSTGQFDVLLSSLEIVELTSNVCIDGKFSGKTEIQRMILDINASCNRERQRSNSKEVLCEQNSRSEFGIRCDVGADSEINSQGYEIISEDYPRIQSLVIKDYKIYDEQRLVNLSYLPVVNRCIRNLIEYEVEEAAVSVIGKENFNGMVWLEKLIIRRTFIETIPEDTFQGLVRLQTINLGKIFNVIYETRLQSIQSNWKPKFADLVNA